MLKLEVGKIYLNSFDRKIKIIGQDCGIFYGKETVKSSKYLVSNSIIEYGKYGEQIVSIKAGSDKNPFDLVKEFKRDPIIIECEYTLEDFINNIHNHFKESNKSKFKFSIKEIVED